LTHSQTSISSKYTNEIFCKALWIKSARRPRRAKGVHQSQDATSQVAGQPDGDQPGAPGPGAPGQGDAGKGQLDPDAIARLADQLTPTILDRMKTTIADQMKPFGDMVTQLVPQIQAQLVPWMQAQMAPQAPQAQARIAQKRKRPHGDEDEDEDEEISTDIAQGKQSDEQDEGDGKDGDDSGDDFDRPEGQPRHSRRSMTPRRSTTPRRSLSPSPRRSRSLPPRRSRSPTPKKAAISTNAKTSSTSRAKKSLVHSPDGRKTRHGPGEPDMMALVLDTYMQTFASAVKVSANVDHILAVASDSLLKKSATIPLDKVSQYIEATHSILGKVQTAIAESEHLQEVMQVLSGLVGADSASYSVVSYRHDGSNIP